MNEVQKNEHKKLLEGARQIMNTSEGRALVRHLMVKSRAFQCDYSMEVAAMYYMQGQRSLGFELLNLLKEQDKNNLKLILTEE